MTNVRALLLAAGFILGGCAVPIARYPVASTRNLVIENRQVETVAENVSAKSTSAFFVLIHSGARIPSIDSAVDEILARYDGDYMTNVRVDQLSIFLLLYEEAGYVVHGDVMRFKRGSP